MSSEKLDSMMAQAISLRVVANDLQNGLNQMARGDNLSTADKTQLSRVGGYFFGAVILRAFATELTLKAISLKQTGQYKKTHDLLLLFEDLEDDTKKIIAEVADNRGIAPLEQILSKHKDDFVEWRYVAEGGTHSVTLLDLDKALEVLMAVYRQP